MEAQPPHLYVCHQTCTVWIGIHETTPHVNMYIPQYEETFTSFALQTGTKTEVLKSILRLTNFVFLFPDNFIIHRDVPECSNSRIQQQLVVTMQALTSEEIISHEILLAEEWRRSCLRKQNKKQKQKGVVV